MFKKGDVGFIVFYVLLFVVGIYFLFTKPGQNYIIGESEGRINTIILCPVALALPLLFLLYVYLSEKLKHRGLIMGVIIIFAAFITIGGGIYYFVNISQKTLSPFEYYITEYLSPSGLKQESGPAYISGRVITVNKAHEIDNIYFKLPNDLRARKPDEVGTIIWIECTERWVAKYISGAEAYSTDCNLTVIDKARAAIVGTNSIYGAAPPDTKKGNDDWHGERPQDDMVAYIITLPRR